MTPERAAELMREMIEKFEAFGLTVSGESECCGCNSAQMRISRGKFLDPDYETETVWL